MNSSISLSLCSFQDLNHTDVRNFGMLRVYFLPFHFQPLRPVCFVLSNLYCPSWISLSQLESPVDSPTESPFPASLVVLSFPLSLSAETASDLVCPPSPSHCEHMNQALHASHIQFYSLLCPLAHSVCWKTLQSAEISVNVCTFGSSLPVRCLRLLACDSFSYLLLPLLAGLSASGSSRDSSCVWGWPLGVFLNFRPLFFAMHQNPSHIYIICISVLFPDYPIARLSLCLHFIEYVCNRGDK